MDFYSPFSNQFDYADVVRIVLLVRMDLWLVLESDFLPVNSKWVGEKAESNDTDYSKE